jgi:hypothetical protein
MPRSTRRSTRRARRRSRQRGGAGAFSGGAGAPVGGAGASSGSVVSPAAAAAAAVAACPAPPVSLVGNIDSLTFKAALDSVGRDNIEIYVIDAHGIGNDYTNKLKPLKENMYIVFTSSAGLAVCGSSILRSDLLASHDHKTMMNKIYDNNEFTKEGGLFKTPTNRYSTLKDLPTLITPKGVVRNINIPPSLQGRSIYSPSSQPVNLSFTFLNKESENFLFGIYKMPYPLQLIKDFNSLLSTKPSVKEINDFLRKRPENLGKKYVFTEDVETRMDERRQKLYLSDVLDDSSIFPPIEPGKIRIIYLNTCRACFDPRDSRKNNNSSRKAALSGIPLARQASQDQHVYAFHEFKPDLCVISIKNPSKIGRILDISKDVYVTEGEKSGFLPKERIKSRDGQSITWIANNGLVTKGTIVENTKVIRIKLLTGNDAGSIKNVYIDNYKLIECPSVRAPPPAAAAAAPAAAAPALPITAGTVVMTTNLTLFNPPIYGHVTDVTGNIADVQCSDDKLRKLDISFLRKIEKSEVERMTDYFNLAKIARIKHKTIKRTNANIKEKALNVFSS